MIYKIKKCIEKNLIGQLKNLEKIYFLSGISPLLAKSIKEFILRKGKRLRPILFVIGYLGFTKRAKRGLYTSAISLELLHDFLLIHDDIIDKSNTRRGKPSLHTSFNLYLKSFKNTKVNGQDLAIVTGDIIYALALQAFLAIKEEPRRKEKALERFIQAAFYTGCGEFIELITGLRDIGKIKKGEIYKIYDYKTAYYTFAFPLAIGATLAGANQSQIKKLSQYGISLGRAFQIQDDILGMFGREREIGKSIFSDLQEAKRTLLIWYAYRNSNTKDKLIIKTILNKSKISKFDLTAIRRTIVKSQGLDFAQKEILRLSQEANILLRSCAIHPRYKRILSIYTKELLNL